MTVRAGREGEKVNAEGVCAGKIARKCKRSSCLKARANGVPPEKGDLEISEAGDPDPAALRLVFLVPVFHAAPGFTHSMHRPVWRADVSLAASGLSGFHINFIHQFWPRIWNSRLLVSKNFSFSVRSMAELKFLPFFLLNTL